MSSHFVVLQGLADFDHWCMSQFSMKPRIRAALFTMALCERPLTKCEIDAYLKSSDPEFSGGDLERMCRRFCGMAGNFVVANKTGNKFEITEDGLAVLDLIGEEFKRITT